MVNVFFAQDGSSTAVVCCGAKDSPPPKPFDATGFPEGRGVRTAVIARSFLRYSRATRFTSSPVTFLSRFDVVVGRGTAFDGQGLGPGIGKSGNGVLPELGIAHFMPLCRFHKIRGQAILHISVYDILDGGYQAGPVSTLGKPCRRKTEPRFRKGLGIKIRKERLPLGDQGIEVSAPASQHVRQDHPGREVRAVEAGKTIGHDRKSIGQIGIELNRSGFERLEIDDRPGRHGPLGNGCEEFLHHCQCFWHVHVTNDDEDGIVRPIPGLIKLLEHGARRLLE